MYFSEVEANSQAIVSAVQHIVQQLLTATNNSTNEQVMTKLAKIEQQLSRDIHVNGSIDTSAETFVAASSEAPSNGTIHMDATEVDADSQAEATTEASSVMLSK